MSTKSGKEHLSVAQMVTSLRECLQKLGFTEPIASLPMLSTFGRGEMIYLTSVDHGTEVFLAIHIWSKESTSAPNFNPNSTD
jgi:hypothetical protein